MNGDNFRSYSSIPYKSDIPCKYTVGVGAVRITVPVVVTKVDVTRIVVVVPVIVTAGAVKRKFVKLGSPSMFAVHSFVCVPLQFLGHFLHWRIVVTVVVIVVEGVQKSYCQLRYETSATETVTVPRTALSVTTVSAATEGSYLPRE